MYKNPRNEVEKWAQRRSTKVSATRNWIDWIFSSFLSLSCCIREGVKLVLTNWAAVNKTQMAAVILVLLTNAIFLLACLIWIVLLSSSFWVCAQDAATVSKQLRHDNMCDKKSFMTHFSLWATDGESQTVVKWAGKMSSFSVSSLNSNLHFCGGNSVTKSK